MERAQTTVFTDVYSVVSGNIIGSGFSYNIDINYTALIQNNLFLEGGGIHIGGGASAVSFQNNIVDCRFICDGDPPGCFCNNLLSPDNACLQEIWERFSYDNFSADPQFCGVDTVRTGKHAAELG